MKFNDSIYVGRECHFCGDYHEVEVSESDYAAWRGGELAQDAFPYLTAKEREILISGICPKCWADTFGDDEEENEEECFEPGRPVINMFELNP